jgi:hypothetical protein
MPPPERTAHHLLAQLLKEVALCKKFNGEEEAVRRFRARNHMR